MLRSFLPIRNSVFQAVWTGLLVATSSVATAGCSVFGYSSVKEPPFSVVVQEPPYEVRRYEPMLIATTQVEGSFSEAQDEAFSRLFDYISGQNEEKESITMTAPVFMGEGDEESDSVAAREPISQKNLVGFQEKSETGWAMSFVLPEKYTALESSPSPTDSRVELRRVPARLVAVQTFSGRWKRETFEERSQELLEWLHSTPYTPISKAKSAAFNPPWTLPFLRRTEIQIEVEAPSSTP